MKNFAHRFIALALLAVIFVTSPQFLLAQDKLIGELTITGTNAGVVTVNGETALSGRSVMSPSEITTAAQTTVRVTIPQTGVVMLAPNSRMNLSFIQSGISGDLRAGEVTIETAPNTKVNLLTSDGTITVSNPNQINIFKVGIENGQTRLTTLTGEARFNSISVPAGDFYPKQATSAPLPADNTGAASNSATPLLLLGILGAAGAIALIALAGGGSDDNRPPVLSPVR